MVYTLGPLLRWLPMMRSPLSLGLSLSVATLFLGAAHAQDVNLGGWVLRNQVVPAEGYSAQPDNYFGRAVSVSGAKAVVGSPHLEEGTGLAYFFDFQGGAWTQEEIVTSPHLQAEDDFGVSVSLWYGTAVIGAPGENDEAGAVHVFDVQTGTWQHVAEINAAAPVSEARFGESVALSRNTLAIGSPGTQTVHLFQWSGSTWDAWTTIVPPQSAEGFGAAIGYDGTTLVVGAPDSDQAFVYRVDAQGAWGAGASLTVPLGASKENLGFAIALDDPVLVLGAPDDMGAGEAHVFAYDGAAWSHSETLTPNEITAESTFGEAVALEGNLIAIGAPGDDQDYGSVTVFRQGLDTWIEEAQFTPEVTDPLAEGNFGRYVSVYGGLVHSNFGLEDSPILLGYSGSVTVWAPLSSATRSDPQSELVSSGDGSGLAFQIGPAYAGSPYVVLGSVSGTWPGAELEDVHVQLQPDVYTTLTQGGVSLLAGGVGTFDATGKATATYQLPPSTLLALQGLTVAHAIVVFDKNDGSVIASGEPVVVTF